MSIKAIKSLIFGAIIALAISFGVSAKPNYVTLPPVQGQALPDEISGIWIPATYPAGSIGLSLTVIAGKYFIASQFGLPDTCGNYLGLRGSFPKTNPNTTIAGERDVVDPQNPISFGTEFLLRIPGKPGFPAYVRIDSYSPQFNRLYVTVSQNSFGFNGQIELVRQVTISYPTPLGCIR